MFCKYNVCPPHNPGEPPPQARYGYLPLTYSLSLDILVCKLGIQSTARRVYMRGLPAACPLPETRRRAKTGSQFTGGLSPSSVRRTRRPHTSATLAGSRCARAAATRRTGHACSRATTSWPWASAAATCSRSAVSAACGDGAGAGRGWGRALPGALTAVPAAALHAEPYVLFSTDKKSLLCIRCFRDMQGWVEGAGGEGLASVPERGSRAGSLQGEPRPLRGPRVSLRPGLRAAAAGGAGERGLPGAPGPGLGTRVPRRLRPPCPQEVKALQTATREAIELLQAMVEEVRRSAAEEEAAIHALFSSMQVRHRGDRTATAQNPYQHDLTGAQACPSPPRDSSIASTELLSGVS